MPSSAPAASARCACLIPKREARFPQILTPGSSFLRIRVALRVARVEVQAVVRDRARTRDGAHDLVHAHDRLPRLDTAHAIVSIDDRRDALGLIRDESELWEPEPMRETG